MRLRGGPTLTSSAAEALMRVLGAPTFELLPLKNATVQAAFLPQGARVSVTASPAKGIEATLTLCEQLRAAGFVAVPHLSARMIRDRAHLTDVLAHLGGIGVDSAFVVGGDAATHGAYPDGLALLRDMSEVGHRLGDVGIPCYPQGHPLIGDARLLGALRDKAPFASYMTTQLCFDPAAIAGWLAARRSEGIALPAHIGVPGVLEPHRLLAISARIGVADSRRYIGKNLGFVARLMRSGGFFRPNALLAGLAPHIADRGLGISGLHVYTFNAVEPTEAWRRNRLTELDRIVSSDAAGRMGARGAQ